MYSAKKYEFLFNNTCDGVEGDMYDILRHKDVYRYRTYTIKSGNNLELEIFPIWNTKSETRKAEKATTREAQAKLNVSNAKKKLVRKINTNFTGDDLSITLTYADGERLPDEKQARKDMQNFIRRVRAFRKKHGLPELKYMYVIEFTGDEGRVKKRIHHHVIMSGMDRDEAEKLWRMGYANTRRLQPDEYGLEALSRYIVKESHGGKRWCTSKNLKEPQITANDTKLSRRRAQRLAEDCENNAREIFTKLFPGYDFNDCVVKHSDFVAGAYIYARMHKRAEGSTLRNTKKARNDKLEQAN